MSSGEKDPDKKHRHDVGALDHGPVTTESVTKTIQVILGLSIVGTAALMVYALVGAWFEISAP